jgi:uncharacterized protein YdeI (YjbR/CyaY-like superfamily)
MMDVMTTLPHRVPNDLRQALRASSHAFETWQSLTPLARNEWICWIVTVKQPETRAKHIVRAIAELEAGDRRPCCWMGCIHRTDKKVSPSVKGILGL